MVDDYRQKSGNAWQENDLVFPSLIGTPLQPDCLSNEFPALARKAGLPVILFHDCRHTAATLMFLHGIPLVIVGRNVGSLDLDPAKQICPFHPDDAR